MWKVVIVDDEVLVRRGLMTTIPWEKYGMVVVADFPNGRKALDAMETVRPDVVVTDIRMPQLDGLELIRIISSRYPDTVTLILSCYDDFEYAKQAMSLGAAAYLLKTSMDDGEVDQTLTKIQRKLAERKDRVALRERLEQSRWYERQAGLRAALTLENGGPSPPVRGDWPDKGVYGLVAARCHADRAPLSLSFRCMQFAELYRDDPQLLCCVDVDRDLVLLLHHSATPSEAELQDFYRTWSNRLHRHFAVGRDELYVGMSRPFPAVDGVRQAYLQALSGLESFFYGRTEPFPADAERPMPFAGPLISAEDRRRLLEAVAGRAFREAKEIIGRLMEQWKEGVPSQRVKEAAAVILHMLRTVGSTREEWNPDVSAEIMNAGTLAKVKDIICEELAEWEKETEMDGQRTLRPEIRKALDYIEEHLGENLKMATVADAVNLSRSHFSALFKQAVGKTFLEYVMDRRMEKAKRLLKLTRQKSYEVAGEVGFSDYKYFTRCFKEYTGMTPTEWRGLCC